MKKELWWGILIGFCGILFILHPARGYVGLISWLGILCGILQAFSVVGIRKLSLLEPTSRVLFYYFLVGTLLSGCFALTNWINLLSSQYLLLSAVGLMTYLGQKFVVLSLQFAQAARLAPICYSSILFSGLIAWWLWQEIPSVQSFIGMFLVVAGCIINIMVAKPR